RVASAANGTSRHGERSRTASSAAGEPRRSLLAQRRQRLAVVLAAEGHELERGRGVEGDVERVLQKLVHRELGVAYRERRAGREAVRELERALLQLLGRHDEVDEPDALRLCGWNRVAGQQVLLRAR